MKSRDVSTAFLSILLPACAASSISFVASKTSASVSAFVDFFIAAAFSLTFSKVLTNCSVDLGISSGLISAPAMLSTKSFSAAILASAALLSAFDSVERRLLAALSSALCVSPVPDETVGRVSFAGVFVASMSLLSSLTDRDEIVGIIGAVAVVVVVWRLSASCICARSRVVSIFAVITSCSRRRMTLSCDASFWILCIAAIVSTVFAFSSFMRLISSSAIVMAAFVSDSRSSALPYSRSDSVIRNGVDCCAGGRAASDVASFAGGDGTTAFDGTTPSTSDIS